MGQDVHEKHAIKIFRKKLCSVQVTVLDIICVQNRYSLVTQDPI